MAKGIDMNEYWEQLVNVKPLLQLNQSKRDLKPKSSQKRIRYQVSNIKGIYFTLREYQCIQLMFKGHTMKEAADQLNLSARTVEFYLQNVKDKMGVRSIKQVLYRLSDSSFNCN